MSAPRQPLTADDLERYGDTWVFDGRPVKVHMAHGRTMVGFGVVMSTDPSLWGGPYPHTVTVRGEVES